MVAYATTTKTTSKLTVSVKFALSSLGPLQIIYCRPVQASEQAAYDSIVGLSVSYQTVG